MQFCLLLQKQSMRTERSFFLEFDYEESNDEMYNKRQFRNHLEKAPLPCYHLYERVLNQQIHRDERDLKILSETISNYKLHVKVP